MYECGYNVYCTFVGRFKRRLASINISRAEAMLGADLGGSSKQSSEILENRSGKGFHVNSSWTWVNRSLGVSECE